MPNSDNSKIGNEYKFVLSKTILLPNKTIPTCFTFFIFLEILTRL